MPGTVNAARRLYALAARLGIGIGEACDRAGIARSTPPRWKAGTKARPQQLEKLRRAILDIARENGVVVPPLSGGIRIGPTVDRAALLADIAAIREAADRIEAALSQDDGA